MSDEEEFAKLDKLGSVLIGVIKGVFVPSTPKDYLTLSGALLGISAEFLRKAGEDPVEFLKGCLDIGDELVKQDKNAVNN